MSAKMDAALEEAGREPHSIKRSIMLNVVAGRTDAEVKHRMGGYDGSRMPGGRCDRHAERGG